MCLQRERERERDLVTLGYYSECWQVSRAVSDKDILLHGCVSERHTPVFLMDLRRGGSLCEME